MLREAVDAVVEAIQSRSAGDEGVSGNEIEGAGLE